MKNQIKKTFNKLFLIVGLLTLLTGSIFAQSSIETDKQEISKKVRRELGRIVTKQFSANELSVKKSGQNVSAINQYNFNIGTQFVLTVLDASLLENNKDARNATIIDLVYLIDLLEGQTESAVLQETLQKVVRKKTDSAQVRKEIINASKTYSTRLTKEQKWFYASGMTITDLLINTYLGNNTAINKNLSQLQTLIKIAPKGTNEKIIDQMQTLANYAARTNFAKDDYAALQQVAIGVVNGINA